MMYTDLKDLLADAEKIAPTLNNLQVLLIENRGTHYEMITVLKQIPETLTAV